MSDRLQRARRVLAIQSQFEKAARWQLIDLQRHVSTLEDQQSGLTRFIQRERAFAGIFSSTIMRRLQSVAESLAKATAKEELQRVRFSEQRERLRRAQRVVEALETDAQRKDASRELAEAIETAAQRQHKPPASPLRQSAENGI